MDTSKCLQRKIMKRNKLKVPIESGQARSARSSRRGCKAGSDYSSPPLQEKVKVQTQRQKTKGKAEIRHSNENREINWKSTN